MSRRTYAMLAGVAALAIFIGGCGGGDDGNATGGSTADGSATAAGGELTKGQYIKRADAACSKANEGLSQSFREYAEAHPIKKGELTKAQSEEFNEKIVFPYVEDRIQILQGLNPPAADEKQVEAIVAVTEASLAKAKETLGRVKQTQDPYAKAESMSRTFGLEICGET